MRVISGSARGTRLKMVPGDTTRPIMDRVKENLFNIIGVDVYDSVWLDLFAGTGQVGIEALSRGAESAVFIDAARQAVRTISHNLKATRLTEQATIVQGDAFAYLRNEAQAKSGRFDYIYIAPPQYLGLWIEPLHIVDGDPAALIRPGGQVIVQIDPKEYVEQSLNQLVLADQRVYGRTMLCFYEWPLADTP